MQSLYRDLGIPLPVRAWTDSSAAMGIARRQGLGKLWHLECQSLWVQQRLRRGEFTLHKVAGESNPSELFTKHLDSQKKLGELLQLFRCKLLDGRPVSAPALKRETNPAMAGMIEVDDAEGFVAEAHEGVVPHEHLPEDLARMFPKAIPSAAGPGEEHRDPSHVFEDRVPRIKAREARGKISRER